MSQEWKQGTFGCFGDCGTCVFGSCCPCCMVCQNANDLGKPGFLCLLLSCFCPCLAICMLRGEARERYGIEGSTGGDAVCAYCCGPCINCQTASEIKQRGDHN